MRDHGPIHLGDLDHAISKFTAEMRQHGAPWQVEGGTKRSGWSLLKVFCLREIWLWFKTRVPKGGVNDFEPRSFESFDTSIGSKYKHHLL